MGRFTFSKNRDRLLAGNVARELYTWIVQQAEDAELMSDEHFTGDGTLIKAWASDKSFQQKGTPPEPADDPGNPTVNFRGEKRSNETHASTTDPEARLARKGNGKEAKLPGKPDDGESARTYGRRGTDDRDG